MYTFFEHGVVIFNRMLINRILEIQINWMDVIKIT